MTRRILLTILTLGLSICIAISVLAMIAAAILFASPGAKPLFF